MIWKTSLWRKYNVSFPSVACHNWFASGREIVEDESRSGRPSSTRTNKNINRVKALVSSDRKLTVRILIDHFPYSPDFAPCGEFWLLPGLKNVIKGLHFGLVDKIKKPVTKHLRPFLKVTYFSAFKCGIRE